MSLQRVRSLLSEALASLSQIEAEQALADAQLSPGSVQSATPQANVGAFKLDLSAATPPARLPEHHGEGPIASVDAPSSYVLIGADSPFIFNGSPVTSTEHGG